MQLKTRKQVEDEGLISTAPYSVINKIYIAIHNDRLEGVHIPHSDVYFVRAALEKRTGYYFGLDAVEKAMKAEGWKDRKGIHRYADPIR
jgi:hypothetical protein